MATSIFFLVFLLWNPPLFESACSRGCDLALGSYYVSPALNLHFISKLFEISDDAMLPFNPEIINKDSIRSDTRLNVPFSCDCIKGDFLGRIFTYMTAGSDNYERIASGRYANLTTLDLLSGVNSFPPTTIPNRTKVDVPVNCFCGDKSVSVEYGLFVTYPLRAEDSLKSLAKGYGFLGQEDLLQRYNPGKILAQALELYLFPLKIQLKLSSSYFKELLRRRKARRATMPVTDSENNSNIQGHDSTSGTEKSTELTHHGSCTRFTGFAIDKSVEFSYKELAKATNDFALANKIGEGGFGAVYYAELRGEKTAIKKMDMRASSEFLAELKVLTRVHHLNLVRLIGYCTEGSLFLVYEFVENGNLSQHLRGSGGRETLQWSSRIQIALDSARGLEYIHEHTVPVYIHRDIKSANILIDQNFHGKVADFGLANLTEVGSLSLPTVLAGTFGYMPPEYAQFGVASPKVDVYAFGVVLYELISAREVIFKTNECMDESKCLVALFERILKQPDPTEELRNLVDARLGNNYPVESVLKMAQLARACTQENPQLRPSMRSIVVALMTLSSPNEDWDISPFYENQAFVNLISGG
ncbi:hypothetical protein HPP92_007047 [Vanilla planifolia]|uniref:non-specific serine/threonine protein kinase n=1 Tax=Vanilla planifolia TaxID=51239 RepID=A0A835RFL3_VANPL|nr:hypothetical protein HPP92_007047 [Vanilla planifolia]